MAAKKTTTAAKTATKAAAKTVEEKAASVKATVETKPAKAVEKEVVKAEEAVKAELEKEVKTAEKKPAAKKTTTRKPAAKKPEKTQEVFVQVFGREVSSKTIMEKVEAAWVAMGNKADDITDVKVYIKPEEFQVYYVINGNVTGSVEM